jgi:hypothetical protein
LLATAGAQGTMLTNAN